MKPVPKTIAIIQARMGSTRLPGKVLMDLAGEPMLVRVVERTRRSPGLDGVVVATTTSAADDAIVALCRERGWPCFRGSEDDVLARYIFAAVEHTAEAVIRVTSDCPLTDPDVVGAHIQRLHERWTEVDFVTNMIRQTFPLGVACEAMPFDALARMHRLTQRPDWREHVATLPYMRPELFVIDHIVHDEDLSHLRWTVDTPEDMELVRRLFVHFGNDRFSWLDAVQHVRAHPELTEINRHVRQKTV